MSNFARIGWLLVLVCFVSGCANYRGAYLPVDSGPPQSDENSHPIVKKGMAVRVTLITGKTITGSVSEVSEQEIVLEKVGNYGIEKRAIPSSEIQSIEMEHYSRTEEGLFKVSMVLLGVATLGMILIAYSLRDFSFE